MCLLYSSGGRLNPRATDPPGRMFSGQVDEGVGGMAGGLLERRLLRSGIQKESVVSSVSMAVEDMICFHVCVVVSISREAGSFFDRYSWVIFIAQVLSFCGISML